MRALKTQWRPPTQWEDFEDLCYRVALAKGDLTSLHKYGRRGQEQFGVDIAGTSPASRTEWTGFQCKLKTESLRGHLTEQEILAEYDKSKAFRPQLTHWILATTSSRDGPLQDVVNRLNASFQRVHTAELWFWQDFEEFLDDHPKVAVRFYPNVLSELAEFDDGALCVHLFSNDSANDRRKKLDAFFRHPFFRSHMRTSGSQVSTAILEVVDNSLQGAKGGAIRMTVEFDGIQVRLLDNGQSFDPFDEHLQLKDDQFSVRAIRAFRDPTSQVTAEYMPRDIDEGITSNCLYLTLKEASHDAAIESCTEVALTREWQTANAVVRKLESAEAGWADVREAGVLPPRLAPLVEAACERQSATHNFVLCRRGGVGSS